MVQRKLKDYLTGRMIPATPEEPNRQEMLKRLHEDYGYPKDLMREEYGVRRSPSDVRRTVPEDIAVFDSKKDIKNNRPKIFVETKRPNLQQGKKQLKMYMSLIYHPMYGIWYDGKNKSHKPIAYFKKTFDKNNVPKFTEVFDVPRYRQKDVRDQIPKDDLHPTNNLRSIFDNLRGYLAANAHGITQDQTILQQLSMIIISKLFDEKYNNSKYVEFRLYHDDNDKVSASITARHVKDLFNKAKQEWMNVFSNDDKFILDDEDITYIVSQLEHYSLTKTKRNVVSEAFEDILTHATKGTQGQFFTPQNVSRLMVAIANPSKTDSIYDPASGTGQFLVDSMFHVWNEIRQETDINLSARRDLEKNYASNHIFGTDKDRNLIKASKAYMAMLGDGRAGLYIQDSLIDPNKWHGDAQFNIGKRCFDIILSNPPFGKNIRLKKETANRYEFGNKIYLAFMEMCLRHLKPNGILGIIVPETVLHSHSKKNRKVRKDLFYKYNITALIDLPHATFQPYNNAKTDIVFLKKNPKQQKYVTVINIKNIGHDHDGRPKHKIDPNTYELTNKIADDTVEIINDLKNDNPSSMIKRIPFSTIKNRDLLVARPYFSKNINRTDLTTLGMLINKGIVSTFKGDGSPQGYMKGLGSFPYVRVKDIVNLEIAHNRQDDIPASEYNRLKKTDLRPEDIILVRRGSYRIGDVGMVYPKDLNSLLTGELQIFRVNNNNIGLTPFNLIALLNSHFVRKQMPNLVLMDTTLPNMDDRWKYLCFNISNKKKLKSLDSKMRKMYKLRNNYWNTYHSIFHEW